MAKKKAATRRKKTTTAKSLRGTTTSVGLNQVPLRTRKKPDFIAEPSGSTGLGRNWQNVDDEWHPKLRGARAIRTFREMRDNDAICGVIYYSMDTAIRNSTREALIKPAEDSPMGNMIADHVSECFDDMDETKDEWVSDINSMIWAGYSIFGAGYKVRRGLDAPHEMLQSKYDDGRVGWRTLPIRNQETIKEWRWRSDGKLLGCIQSAPPNHVWTYLDFEDDDLTLFRTISNKQSPEGRALTLDTPVPTPEGWTTMGEIDVGERVYDETGRVRYVVAKTPVWKNRKTYRVTFSTGTTIDADENHLWSVTTNNDRNLGKGPRTMTTLQIAERLAEPKTSPVFCCGNAPVLDGHESWLPVDPYMFGYWLGDGSVTSGAITVSMDDAESLCGEAERAGFEMRHNDNRTAIVHGLREKLRVAGLIDEKHIPTAYLRASFDQRLALLQGLMDSDGSSPGRESDQATRYWTTNTDLRDQVAELIRTLGGRPRIRLAEKAGRPGGIINGHQIKSTKDLYEISFFLPFDAHRLPRKLEKQGRKSSTRVRGHFISSVEEIGQRDTVCIEVDGPSHLFLAGEAMVPTHNSLFRNAYRSWYYLKRIQELEAIGIERDLAGMLVLQMPLDYFQEGASDEQETTLENYRQVAERIRRGEHESLVYPGEEDADGKTGFKASLMQSGGRRPIDTNPIIMRIESRIALSVLAEAPLLGTQGDKGSWALSSTKTHMLAVATNAMRNTIKDKIDRNIIPRLVRLNGWPVELSPTWEWPDMETDETGEFASALAALTTAGILVPDPDIERYVRTRYGLPMQGEISEGQMQDAVGEDLEEPNPDIAAEAAAQAVIPIEEQKGGATEVLDVDEAAAFLRTSRNRILNAVRRRQLPGARVGNTYRIVRQDLMDYMHGQEAA